MLTKGLEKGGVLALDLGSRTIGWCLGWDEGPDRRIFGDWTLPRIGGRGVMFLAADNIIWKSIEACEPSHILVEDVLPVFGQTSTGTAKKQMGLEAITMVEAARYSISFSSVSASLVRDALLGQSRFAKPGDAKKEVIAFCRRKGWAVTSHHQGDAVCLYEWRRRQMRNVAPAAGPLWRELTY